MFHASIQQIQLSWYDRKVFKLFSAPHSLHYILKRAERKKRKIKFDVRWYQIKKGKHDFVIKFYMNIEAPLHAQKSQKERRSKNGKQLKTTLLAIQRLISIFTFVRFSISKFSLSLAAFPWSPAKLPATQKTQQNKVFV